MKNLKENFCYAGGFSYDLYKYGTLILFVSCVMALVAIHFICPLRWNRHRIIKTLSSMKRQHSRQSTKKKRRNFFDTRSISANTEFDFQPVGTSEQGVIDEQQTRLYPASILRTEAGGKKQSPVTPEFDVKEFPSHLKKQVSQRSILVSQSTAPLLRKPESVSTLPPEDRSSFCALHENILSTSRGQLVKDQHRRQSVVTFKMDGQPKQNRYNTIAHKPRSRTGLDLNFQHSATNHHHHQKYAYFSNVNQFPSHSALTKKYSSSQDLTNSSSITGEIALGINQNKKLRFFNYTTSVPDFHKQGLVASGGAHLQTAIQNTYRFDNRELDTESMGKRLKEETSDEGQMQCVFEFDLERFKLKIKDLQVQTMFPPGVPGFVVEVMLEPRADTEVARSKVYVTVEQQVEIQLEEIFQISCSKEQLMKCSVIISVIPILGNMVFVVETGLNELNLIGNGEIFLGGFFKGMYSQTF